MWRGLAIALLLAGLGVPLCLHAQPRSASRAAFSGAHVSYRHVTPAPRAPQAVRPVQPTNANGYPVNFPPAGNGQSLIDYGQSACLFHPSYSGSFFCQQYYKGRPSFGFEPVYPYWWPSTNYESEQPSAPAPEPESQLANQVANLANEVEWLREDQAARTAPAPPTAEIPEKSPATILVYRDGRRVEIQNYAIQGQTLWVFSEESTRRVALGDLDLAATKQSNEERGVDFVTPSSQEKRSQP